MKRLLVGIICLPLCALLLGACAAAAADSGPVAVEIGCDTFNAQPQTAVEKTVVVSAGRTVSVALCSNPSTGFSWEEPKVADASLLQVADHQTIAASGTALGAAGKETWTLTALKTGKTSVAFAYSRPWAGGEKGVWKVNLTVEVR